MIVKDSCSHLSSILEVFFFIAQGYRILPYPPSRWGEDTYLISCWYFYLEGPYCCSFCLERFYSASVCHVNSFNSLEYSKRDGCYYYHQFTDKKTEDQRSYVICPRSRSQVADLGFWTTIFLCFFPQYLVASHDTSPFGIPITLELSPLLGTFYFQLVLRWYIFVHCLSIDFRLTESK